MNPLYPIYLKLEGVSVVVVGGGRVAHRKIVGLLQRGARVTCVSREFIPALKRLAKQKNFRLALKKRKTGSVPLQELKNARLAVVATSDRELNARVAAACRLKKIWVNVADDPGLCDFYAAAVLERGPLQVAISTGGASPLFSRRLREALEKVIPDSIGRALEQMGRVRDLRLRGNKK